jgi:hypothetical protein
VKWIPIFANLSTLTVERESSPRLPRSHILGQTILIVLMRMGHDGKKYKMLNCKRTNGSIPYNVVFPSQFAHLVVQYQQHPEAKSLAPDGTPCGAETKGLLRRAYVLAGEIRYVGKETDRKFEEGDEISVLEFAATEYGRKGKVVATEDVKRQIKNIGINKCARESGFHRANFIRKLMRGGPVKRNSYNEFVRLLSTYKSD